MEERRQFVRLDTRLDVSYTILPTTRAQHTSTKNISQGGICLFAKQVLTPGTRMQIAMKLPGREAPVNFVAEVVWCESYEVVSKTEQRREIEAGMQFVEIAPQDQEALMRHVILSLKLPPPTV